MITPLMIVPRVPPALCGVGDHAWLLARRLRDRHDVHFSFLAAGTEASAGAPPDDFPVFRLASRSSRACRDFLAKDGKALRPVVLHLSSYGYHKRAMPLWLARAARDLSLARGGPGLIVMFHELYSSGPVTTSAFWTQPLQKLVVRMIARAADAVRTNIAIHARLLHRLAGLDPATITVMPVFSNFGELDPPPALDSRPSEMVMFCSGVHGGADIGASLQLINGIARRFGITRLHLIGKNCPPHVARLDVPYEHHPWLSADAISALLGNCRIAFNGYPPLYLAKSGIFAAHAAHGLAVFAPGAGMADELPDGLRFGRELLRADDSAALASLDLAQLQSAASQANAWYQRHSLAQSADSYARDIEKLARSPRSDGRIATPVTCQC